jgi:hypothetical protein
MTRYEAFKALEDASVGNRRFYIGNEAGGCAFEESGV